MPLAPLLRSARFENFKGLHDVALDLERLTVLVGPNAVGKTSILESIFLTGQAVRQILDGDSPRDVFAGRWAPDLVTRKGQPRSTVDLQLGGGRLRLSLEKRPVLSWLHPGDPEAPLSRTLPSLHRSAMNLVSGAFKLRLDQEQIALPSPAIPGPPSLRPDGSGLAAFLQYLHGLRDGTLDAIEEHAQAVIPGFQRVQFKPTSIEQEEWESIVIDGERIVRPTRQRQAPGIELHLRFDDGVVVPATHASEGTVIVLALLTAAYAPHGQSLLLIDDLDRALHPAAQYRLMKALRRSLELQPGLQIIATSHSPDLVNACQPDEVRVMGLVPGRGPVVAALGDHPEATKWLAQLSPGEFWESAGEDWVGQVTAPRSEGEPGRG